MRTQSNASLNLSESRFLLEDIPVGHLDNSRVLWSTLEYSGEVLEYSGGVLLSNLKHTATFKAVWRPLTNSEALWRTLKNLNYSENTEHSSGVLWRTEDRVFWSTGEL